MIWVNGKEIAQEHFSAGELKIKLFPSSREVVDVVWHYENDAELFTIGSIREYYMSRPCRLYIPYLPHARMDRVKNVEDVFTLKAFARYINALNFSTVYVWDAHSNVGPALIDRCVDVSAQNYIEEAIKQLGYAKNSICLFFPDEGAQKRYGTMFPDYPQAFGIKKRNWETQRIEGYMIVGEENIRDKYVLIIDDICSYGGTFLHSARKLKELGANDIYLYVSHCENSILNGELIKSGLIKKIYTTDSIFTKEHELIEVLK